jgi:hypothetical protein
MSGWVSTGEIQLVLRLNSGESPDPVRAETLPAVPRRKTSRRMVKTKREVISLSSLCRKQRPKGPEAAPGLCPS